MEGAVFICQGYSKINANSFTFLGTGSSLPAF